jgi:uncharacterized protein YqgC (DUF456 family)
MVAAQSPSLPEVMRAHWRAFLPLWLMPVTLIAAVVGHIVSNGNPLVPFGILAFITFPYWYVANRYAANRISAAQLGQWHLFLLGVLGPFVVWCGLVLAFFVVGLVIVALQ